MDAGQKAIQLRKLNKVFDFLLEVREYFENSDETLEKMLCNMSKLDMSEQMLVNIRTEVIEDETEKTGEQT